MVLKNLLCSSAVEGEKSVSIVGTVGVPGSYGGFETLAENLVRYHDEKDIKLKLSVYCSSRSFVARETYYLRAELRFVPLQANGVQSVLYDIWSLIVSVRRKDSVVLVLGVSGAIIFPFLKAISPVRIITNIDGIEWRREKWSWMARLFLRFSELIAVRYSDVVIADNQEIKDYLMRDLNAESIVIPYGGDQALSALPDLSFGKLLPERFALALCRIEPENNVAMILEAFSGLDFPLVFVGNWDHSEYGRTLKARYKEHINIVIHEAVYEPSMLRALRDRASFYVHGHSAGGTNPSLVEMMHFSIPILAHGCSFNRRTTEDKALYFTNALELRDLVNSLSPGVAAGVARDMLEISSRRYKWDLIGRAYFNLMEN